MLLATTRLKPSVRGERLHVDRVAGAGDRARAERQRVGLLARRLQPRVIAAQRRGVAQQEVRDEHRHRAAHVRVRRHQRIAGLLGLIGERGDERAQLLLQQRNAAAQIQPQIDRHLLVARAAGVQPAAGIADARDELALDEPMHVLVVAVDPRRIAPALLENRGQPVANAPGRPRRQHAAATSASAHARLPVTSSSNSRRSNGNDTPKSNAAGSGAASNRPDHRCCDIRTPPDVDVTSTRPSATMSSTMPSRRSRKILIRRVEHVERPADR